MIESFTKLTKFIVTNREDSSFNKILLSFSKGNITKARKENKIEIKDTKDLVKQINILRKTHWCGKSSLEKKGNKLYLCLNEAIEIKLLNTYSS